MVRLHEILKEAGESKHASPTKMELMAQIEQYFEGDFFMMGDSNPNSIKIRVIEPLKLRPGITGRIPFKIHKVFGTYSCAHRELDSLENAPDTIIGRFLCNSNNLTSLEHMPNVNNGMICYENPLSSLKGFETTTKFNGSIKITYTPTLPLLRLMMVPTNSTVSFMEKEFHHQNQYNEVEDLINNYIDTEPELKQRIYKCQYALIKAGYKGNAKW